MKRIFASLLALALTFSLAACGAVPAEEPDGSEYNLVLQPSVSSGQNEADTSNDTAPAEDKVNESADKDANAPASDGQAAPSAKPAQSTQKPTTAPAQNTTPSEPEAKSGTKILIAYFTWADNTVVEDWQAAIDSALKHMTPWATGASMMMWMPFPPPAWSRREMPRSWLHLFSRRWAATCSPLVSATNIPAIMMNVWIVPPMKKRKTLALRFLPM